jgi:hypothetical protein
MGDSVMTEVRPIVGHPGYTISVDGKVVNVKTGRILKGTIRSNGLRTMRLYDGYYSSSEVTLHILLWRTFRGDIPIGSKVAYIDGDKRNVRLDNLTLVPISVITDTNITHPNHRLKPDDVIEIRDLYRSGKTLLELAKMYKVSTTSIFNIVNFFTYRRVGGGKK